MSNFKRKKGIYICFEGLDGSGKSTVVSNLCSELKNQNFKVDFISPTKVLDYNKTSLLESLYTKNSLLERSRTFRMLLYANRSNMASLGTDWCADLILGDRSIITSYVVNWTENKILNKIKILIVNALEKKIHAPDVVIFIDVPYSILDNRLNNRSGKRDMDETLIRAKEMKRAYDSIMHNKKINRIKNVRWYVINGDKPQDEVLEQVREIVSSLFLIEKI